ncbi:phosphoribosylaminoimidazolesuccinocarboxamide synthase [Salinibacter altiplanensis]|uniref:phosphoribosylaminoimidazolesuccinocarboxamide synthase n=1 Tax=Salinibacter altiplanensis TaxID=1803181 RepID=UPI000C9F0516|nr:phosphoribosylaminoimidazolesuccinocarboxamide synthase [Salinibacter altiplanensis]
MDPHVIEDQLDHTIERTHFDDLGRPYHGKVRDSYRQGDRRILVTTDRISAFDHVLPQTIPFKGQILNQTAAYFFEATEDLVPNHVLSVPDPNVTIAKECTPIPIEFVVRGYLAGHAWREYDRGARTLCGQELPEGLRESEQLPEPILTPTTKAEEGHDQDVTRDEALSGTDLDAATYDQLAEWARALYQKGHEMASEQGLLLVDTKYEFGRTPEGNLMLIDEVHTPDSSRYYYASGYKDRLAQGEPQRQLSKEFVREWLMDHGFQGRDGDEMPALPRAFRAKVTRRYVELFEKVTGQTFEPDTHSNPKERIRTALDDHATQESH